MTSTESPNSSRLWPTSFHELNAAEQFLLWCFRRLALGIEVNKAVEWELVWERLTERLGAEAGQKTILGMAKLMTTFGSNARRQFEVHRPCCDTVGRDEFWLLRFLKVCQSGERELAHSMSEWLLKQRGQEAFLMAAMDLMDLLRSQGLDFSDCSHQPLADYKGLSPATQISVANG